MSSIPKRGLKHSATLNTTINRDFWGNPTPATINLRFVFIQNDEELINTNTNQEQKLKAIMFFDIRNSRPKNQQFLKNDTVVFENKTYTIIKIGTKRDKGKINHLEIEMI